MSEQPRHGVAPEGEVVEKTRTDRKVKQPPLFRVIIHNDDYTPMDFVVMVLQTVFHLSDSDAKAVMWHAHTRGSAVAGVYAHEIAEAKTMKVADLARKAEYPLLTTMEPE